MALVYLISFFKEMLNYQDKNKLTPEKVAELVCENMIGEDKLSASGGWKNFGDYIMRENRRNTPQKKLSSSNRSSP